jgi:hypothetical protein
VCHSDIPTKGRAPKLNEKIYADLASKCDRQFKEARDLQCFLVSWAINLTWKQNLPLPLPAEAAAAEEEEEEEEEAWHHPVYTWYIMINNLNMTIYL